MNQKTHETQETPPKYLYYLYGVTLLFISLSGFGQMPIFKRYYIADVPGLGWLAQYFVTHIIHYIAAAVLIGIISYRLTDYLLQRRKSWKLSPSGYVRGGLLAGLMATGALMVMKNFQGDMFSPGFIIWLDLTHIAFVMLFLLTLLYGVIFKKKWTLSLNSLK